MRRKRRQVVVTVTETWTFVFDAAGETPPSASPLDPPPLAPILTPPPDDLASHIEHGMVKMINVVE